MHRYDGDHSTWSRRLACGLVLALLGVGVLGASPAAHAQEQDVDLSTTLGRGRACTQWFYAQEFDKIEALGFNEAMQEALPTMGGLSGFWQAVNTQLGAETSIVDETESQQQGLDVFVRTAMFEKYPGEIIVQWVFEPDGAIAGMAIRPKAQGS